MYFYWQLYAGLVMSAVFFAGNIQSYIPENFASAGTFALFMTSTLPGLRKRPAEAVLTDQAA